MTAAAAFRTDWWAAAACQGQDPDAWHPQGAASEAVLAVCRRCPVRVECLYDALTTETNYDRCGVRGGLGPTQRRDLPPLTGPRTQVLPVLRALLARADHTNPSPVEKEHLMSAPAKPTAPSTAALLAAPPAGKSTPLQEEALLEWADSHAHPDIQDQAARVRVALAGLRARYATDRELAALEGEQAALEKRLAALAARKQELAPAKVRKARASEAAAARTWAAANGVPCGSHGRVPKDVLDQWRAATGTAEPDGRTTGKAQQP